MQMPGDFDPEVHTLVLQIPAGCVVTYGQIARLMGVPGYARRVGRALGTAPAETPCHRVVTASGRTAPGWTAQRTLLEAEGVQFRPNGRVDLVASGWKELKME